MSIILPELQGGRILWQGVEIHLKEIYGEFTIDIMQFIFKLLTALYIFIRDFGLAMQIIRTFWIYTLMDDEVLSVFLWLKSVGTVGTTEREYCLEKRFSDGLKVVEQILQHICPLEPLLL